ncbi:MAG TPA: hypothetical protein VHU84_18610 [Lacipirellulaceae bacterium]|nr:hypothetical protein [Lacipirellulaceae bacterium]
MLLFPSKLFARRPANLAAISTGNPAVFAACAIAWALPFFAHAQAEESPAANPPEAATPLSSKAPSADDINRWIKDLDHDTFSIRQEAASQLLAAGMASRPQLLVLADGPDPETRAAARRLVSLIDRAEFRRRLDAFATDTDGRQGLTLPGWDKFQKLIGGDASARALFVDMQRQEGPLISAVFGSSKKPPEGLFEPRLLRIAGWQNANGERAGGAPPLGSCATMLFLGSLPEMNVTDAAATFIEAIIQHAPIKDLLPISSQTAVRKLVVSWLLQCPNKNEEILRNRLGIIKAMGISDALPLALQVSIGAPEYLHVQPFTKAEAILVVGQLGRREHVVQLEPLLDDTSVSLPPQVLVPGQPAASVQVRDVALCVMLNLTDQAPADYGYINARLEGPHAFQLQTLFRDNDAQRNEAVAKWRTWWAIHKDDVKTSESDPKTSKGDASK